MIVSSRCATVMIVHVRNSSRIKRCITPSVSASTLLVASSRSRILLLVRIIARARQKICCWPCERGDAVISASKPPRGERIVQRPTLVSAVIMQALGMRPVGSAFRRTEPERMKGSCGMVVRFERMMLRGIVLRSKLSIVIEPAELLRMRRSTERRELFPLWSLDYTHTILKKNIIHLPDRPQTPIFSPCLMLNVTFFSAGEVSLCKCYHAVSTLWNYLPTHMMQRRP